MVAPAKEVCPLAWPSLAAASFYSLHQTGQTNQCRRYVSPPPPIMQLDTKSCCTAERRVAPRENGSAGLICDGMYSMLTILFG